jgi:hypothetical protein
MESQIITQTTSKEGPSQRPPRAIVIDPSHTVPPMPLASQLAWVWYAQRLTPYTLGLKANVSTDTILRIEYGGKGTLASFCKVMVGLERRIDIRTWEYRQLLPPEDTGNPEALCRALSEYRLHLFRSGLSWYPWGIPTENRQSAVEHARPNVSLKAFQEYARTVAVHCFLVPVV